MRKFLQWVRFILDQETGGYDFILRHSSHNKRGYRWNNYIIYHTDEEDVEELVKQLIHSFGLITGWRAEEMDNLIIDLADEILRDKPELRDNLSEQRDDLPLPGTNY